MRAPIELKTFLRNVSRSLLHFQPLSGAPTLVSWAGLAKNHFFEVFWTKTLAKNREILISYTLAIDMFFG